MAKGSKRNLSKSGSTFYTSLFIISLVMFVLAVFSGISVYSYVELERAQEEIELMLTLPDGAKSSQTDSLEVFLNGQAFVKEIHYTSKEKAGQLFIEDVGEDFLALMDGINPLPASFDVTLNIAWINQDSLDMINELLLSQDVQPVTDIIYPIGEIEQLQTNTYNRMKLTLGIGLLVAIIGFFIVNSTIRLAIYAKRMVIRSMQLIGATNRFIRWPFLKIGIFQGLLGAIIACALLTGIIFLLSEVDSNVYIRTETIKELLYRKEFMILLGGIVIFGTVLGWLSSSWAVNRFLNKNLDQLI